MTRLPLLALLLTAPLALTACADDTPAPVENAVDAPEPLGTAPAVDDQPVEPRMEDGVQVVDIEAGSMGFQPREFTLQAGVPARLVVTRTVEDDCSSQFTIPAYDVDTERGTFEVTDRPRRALTDLGSRRCPFWGGYAAEAPKEPASAPP